MKLLLGVELFAFDALEWRPPDEDLEEGDAERPDVRLGVVRLLLDDFWGHVVGRLEKGGMSSRQNVPAMDTYPDVGHRQCCLRERLGQAKVAELDRVHFIEED